MTNVLYFPSSYYHNKGLGTLDGRKRTITTTSSGKITAASEPPEHIAAVVTTKTTY